LQVKLLEKEGDMREKCLKEGHELALKRKEQEHKAVLRDMAKKEAAEMELERPKTLIVTVKNAKAMVTEDDGKEPYCILREGHEPMMKTKAVLNNADLSIHVPEYLIRALLRPQKAASATVALSVAQGEKEPMRRIARSNSISTSYLARDVV
jgi:hypothetical protein